MMFDRILVPLDGSENAEAVLPQVKRLMRRHPGEVLLLRALYWPVSLARVDYGRLLREERASAQKYLDVLQGGLAEEGLKVRGSISESPAADAILHAACHEGVTMIAMTTHGRSGVNRLVFGSVTESVLRSTPVPVMVVRSPGPKAAPERPWRRLLAPTDGSEAAIGAAATAAEFARAFGAEVVALHVRAAARVPVAVLGAMPEPIASLPVVEPFDEVDGPAERSERVFAAQGVPSRAQTVEGEPADRILKAAAAEGVDLIAMATHGRSGVRRWVLGSVVERVLRETPVPLLVVRAH